MAWNGSGNFQRTNGSFSGSAVWEDDANAGFDIVDSRHDTHDQDLAQGINNCLTKDGQNSPTADLSMNTFKHTNVGDGTARNHYATVGQLQDQTVQAVSAVGGTANAITATMTPAISAYVTGARYYFKATATNTGATTLKISNAPAVAIQRNVEALVGGEIVSGRYYEVIYDGTNFQLLNTTANPLFLDSVNNRVGIGTTAPTSALQVTGAIDGIPDAVGVHVGMSSGTAYGAIELCGATGGLIDFNSPGVDAKGRIIYTNSDDSMAFNANGAERMRITSAGKVGIGLTDPDYNLDVQADSGVAVGVSIRGRSSDNNGVLLFTNSSKSETARIQANSSELGISKTGANPITFNVNGTKRLEVDGSGRVCFGGTAAVTNAGACWINSAPATEPPFISFAKTFSGSRNVLVNYHNTAYVGGIDMTNTATSFPTSSDYRLKENVVEIPNSLQRLKTLRPVRFNFISEPSQTIDGFLAHEVQEVVPNAVSGEKDEINEDGSIKVQALDHSKLVPLLTAALKELNAKVEAMIVRVEALEA
jgi:hypothetical protein